MKKPMENGKLEEIVLRDAAVYPLWNRAVIVRIYIDGYTEAILTADAPNKSEGKSAKRAILTS